MPILALSGGHKLSYGDTGEGPPLVLVHGSPGEGRSWARVMRHLADFRVLTPDLPGYGGSDPVPPQPAGRTASIARAIAALISGIGEPVWLAGHSYGGNVALHAALRAPQTVRGLLLLEPVFFRALALAGETQAYEDARSLFGRYVERVDAADPAATAIMVDYWFGSGAFDRLPAPVAAFLAAATARNALDVKSCFAEDLAREALRGFDRPAIVACGDDTTTVAPAIARALARLLPDARLRELAGANHGMLDTNPELVAAAIHALTAG